MNILGFSAFGTGLEVGLSASTGYYESRRCIGLHHNQVLLPLIDCLLKDAGITMQNIDLVVCTQGPGSFTALRILLSTAKGLAAGAGAGFIAIPTFDVVGKTFAWAAESVVPYIDGKKNKVYSAFYKQGEKIIPESDRPKEDLLQSITEQAPVLLIGEDIHLFTPDAMDHPDKMKLITGGFSLVHTLLKMGQILYKNVGNCDKLIPPLYIRKSDAELQKKPEP
jgi:tRNA threonylcarbamoyladenosine biosynthesis protein TsaB